MSDTAPIKKVKPIDLSETFCSRITILIIYGGYTLIISKIVGVFSTIQVNISLLTFKDLYQLILIVYMALGIGIGVVGSSISMKKYLEV